MKKKKLKELKKRLDRMEASLFFQEQRLKELQKKVDPPKFVVFKRYQDPFAAIKITKIGEEEENE